MKMKRLVCLFLALTLCFGLAACSEKTAVYVQSVRSLMNMGGIAPGDRFSGMVISEDVTKVEKDADKTVEEVHVKEGDDVKEGQKLFSYDTEELQLTLDKQRLELEQLKTSIENYQSQIETLQRSLGSVSGSTKLQYTVEIQSTQVDLKEAQLKQKTKEAEVKKSEDLLENANVGSPVTGRVQSVNPSGETDRYGNPLPFITIQKSGNYRVKGILGELQRGGIMEGDRVTIHSRTDESAVWGGTVTLVDYENPSQSSNMDQYYGNSSDEMSSSSRYPFYIALDSLDGLLLGQHVYVTLEQEEEQKPVGVNISSAFIGYNEDGSAYVWAEKNGKLEKRTVELGEYNPMSDQQQILSGLTEEDYVAFPDPQVCVEGAPVTREAPAAEAPEEEAVTPEEVA